MDKIKSKTFEHPFLGIVGLVLSIAVGLGVQISQEAAANGPTPEDLPHEVASLYESGRGLGIPEAQLAELIDKVLRGELLDADDQTQQPVEVSEVRQDYQIITREVFADGSVAVTVAPDFEGLEARAASDNAGPLANIKECQRTATSHGVTYRNCLVEGRNLLIYMGHRLDYTVPISGGSTINNYWDATYRSTTGTVTFNGFTRPSQNSVTMNAGYVGLIGAPSLSYKLSTQVSNSGAVTVQLYN